jgi:hypothetical protein
LQIENISEFAGKCKLYYRRFQISITVLDFFSQDQSTSFFKIRAHLAFLKWMRISKNNIVNRLSCPSLINNKRLGVGSWPFDSVNGET